MCGNGQQRALAAAPIQTDDIALSIDIGLRQPATLHLLQVVFGALLLEKWWRGNLRQADLFRDSLRFPCRDGLQCCPDLRIRGELSELDSDGAIDANLGTHRHWRLRPQLCTPQH